MEKINAVWTPNNAVWTLINAVSNLELFQPFPKTNMFSEFQRILWDLVSGTLKVLASVQTLLSNGFVSRWIWKSLAIHLARPCI